MLNTILTHVNEQDTVEKLVEMLQINTVNPPGNEKPLAELIAKNLLDWGVEAEVLDMGHNRANVIGRIRGSGERKALLFDGHLDTVPPGDVPWIYDPYAGTVDNGNVYGRGASDMKGGVTAMLMAVKAVKQSGAILKGDLIFYASIDEETNSLGAIDLLDRNGLDDVGAILIGEPNSGRITIAEKGALWLEIGTKGKTAHGSTPHRGVNAIVHMNAVLNELLKYQFKYRGNELLGYPTINIATFQGGVKTNVVPDQCTVTIDIRTVPGMSHAEIVHDFREILTRLQTEIPELQAHISVLNNRPAVETGVDHDFVVLCQSVLQQEFDRIVSPTGYPGYTDAFVFLSATDIPVVISGPGDLEMAHQPNEFVSIKKLIESVRFYAAVAERYLIL